MTCSVLYAFYSWIGNQLIPEFALHKHKISDTRDKLKKIPDKENPIPRKTRRHQLAADFEVRNQAIKEAEALARNIGMYENRDKNMEKVCAYLAKHKRRSSLPLLFIFRRDIDGLTADDLAYYKENRKTDFDETAF